MGPTRMEGGIAQTPGAGFGPDEDSHLEFLHCISGRLAVADPRHEALGQIVEFLNDGVGADSCFISLLEGKELVLRASKNPHPESVDTLRIAMGEGSTAWVAQKREVVAIHRGAMRDSRFRGLSQLPENGFEAFLSVPTLAGGHLIGVLNLQHRRFHAHSQREHKLVSTIGHLVGAEVERARLDSQVAKAERPVGSAKAARASEGDPAEGPGNYGAGGPSQAAAGEPKATHTHEPGCGSRGAVRRSPPRGSRPVAASAAVQARPFVAASPSTRTVKISVS